jgi:hypothetical protein
MEGTAVATNPSPTGGHQCWTGGAGAGYDSSGCEHFGLAYAGNPTNTQYRWLVEDPVHPGMLKAFGSNVPMAAPVWKVTPPAVPGARPVVAAVIRAPEPDLYEFGDALWVKVFTTESHDRVELEHLVSGDPAVPDEPAETEIEWFLLQASIEGTENEDLENGGEAGEGHESVVRRYEYYKYIGTYDSESHEARDEVPGPNTVGEYVGAQMGAVNLNGNPPAPVVVPEPGTTALIVSGLLAIGLGRRRR